MNRRTPAGEVVERHAPLSELVGDIAVADDRPGDEVREQGAGQTEADGFAFGRHIPPINVGDVSDPLEGEEGYAQRQVRRRQPERRQAAPDQQRVEILGEEVRVFERDQQAEIAENGRDEQPASPARRFAPSDGAAGEKVADNGSRQDPGVAARPR